MSHLYLLLHLTILVASFVASSTKVCLSRDAFRAERQGARETAPASSDFSFMEVQNQRQLDQLQAELGEANFRIVEKLNRRDGGHLVQTSVIVPVRFSDENSFSPFPLEVEALRFAPKAVFVSLELQAFAAYESGTLVRWGPVSSGRRGQETPAGLYFTNLRDEWRRSTVNRNWVMRWYFNLHTSMGVAFHQYEMPGYPASFGCVRLLEDDAVWIYNWADEWVEDPGQARPLAFGTPVLVFGKYDFDRPPPWERLVEQPDATTIDPELLSELVYRYRGVIEARQAERVRVLSEIPGDSVTATNEPGAIEHRND